MNRAAPAPRIAILLGLSLWLALLLVTHRGPMSPYTYALQPPGSPLTRAANEDALTVVAVTKFFYDGTEPKYREAHNLHLPLHSFAVAVVAAFVRRYDVANEIVNLLFLVILSAAALRVADRFGLERRAQLLGLATLFALPPFVAYIGQPMHYIVGPAINYLVILAALAASETQLRNPWFSGALTAILCINYDWYVFAAALAAYVLLVVRLPSLRALPAYLLAALGPAVAWKQYLDLISDDMTSRMVRNYFLVSVAEEWLDFFMTPGERPLFPLAVSQIGASIALHQIVALIYWPLLVCALIVVWRHRGSSPAPARAMQLLGLLVVMFFAEQLLTAAVEWENNPRRAFPFFLAFACVYCWAIHQTWTRPWWRIAFVVLFVVSASIAFSDVVLRTPAAAPLYVGESMREPRLAMQFQNAKIELAPEPHPRHSLLRQSFGRVRISSVGRVWLVANAFAATALVVLFGLLARVEVLPRAAPYVCAAVIASSAIRFLV